MAKSSAFVDDILRQLAPLGPARARPMFGGFGIFMDDVMFALVTRQEVLHLRADDENRPEFEALGMTSHGKMPYYTLPEAAQSDASELVKWAGGALEAARRAAAKKAKKKPKRR